MKMRGMEYDGDEATWLKSDSRELEKYALKKKKHLGWKGKPGPLHTEKLIGKLLIIKPYLHYSN